jgi:phage protein D
MAQQTAIPVYQRGNGTETFYVPAFEIRMKESKLPKEVLHDVQQVTYKDSINEMDYVELVINNWDAITRKFKYVGLDEKDLDPKFKGLFDFGQKVEVYMGYQQPLADTGGQSSLKLMMLGKLDTLEQDFPNGGNPTLTVRAYNILNSFRKQQHTYTWENKRDSEIAEDMGKRAVSKDKPGLGIEVHVGKKAQREPKEPIVFMHNQFDILFLLERARRHGYSVHLDEEIKDGKPKQFLYFGQSDTDTFITYKLEWGKSLVQFHPTLTTANQVMQVTVRGNDRHANKAIEATAKWGDDDIKLNLDLKELVKKHLDGRGTDVVNHPVHTVEQARAMAKDLLLDHLKEMLKASGATVGLPDLLAGRTVQIGGLGKYFSGTYFITDTTHTIGNDGYRTTFNARREDTSQQ